MNKDILTLLDLEKEDFELFFKRALELKKIKRRALKKDLLQEKHLVLYSTNHLLAHAFPLRWQ